MRLRTRGTVFGAIVIGSMLLSSCGPEAPPAQSPTPSVSDTPTLPPSPTPTESAQEKQERLDYEAAETVYRKNLDEMERIFARGGGQKATPIMRETATGEYLKVSVSLIRQAFDSKKRVEGRTKIVGFSRGGWKEDRIELVVCEDISNLVLRDRKGRDVTPRLKPYYKQEVTLKGRSGHWKLAQGATTRLNSLKGQPCVG